MAGMRMSDVVAPSVELAQARLSEAIALKHRMLTGPFAAQAVEVARRIDRVPPLRRKGDLLRQRRVRARRWASRR